MIDTIDAHDAWWPPTFSPDGYAHPVGVVDDRARQPQHAVLTISCGKPRAASVDPPEGGWCGGR
ncbi:hypothetical protein [Streptomyces sp. KL116D]|uniref:hypothetical protein n=1 Tax=Streptomyces sp. KL116D TaxID=3045152 RepID=UPI0035563197